MVFSHTCIHLSKSIVLPLFRQRVAALEPWAPGWCYLPHLPFPVHIMNTRIFFCVLHDIVKWFSMFLPCEGTSV